MSSTNQASEQIDSHDLGYLEYIAEQRPRVYFSLVLCAALLGYAVLLLPPVMAFIGFYQLSTIFDNGSHSVDYQSAIIWYAVTVLSISISYHILSLKFGTKIGTHIKDKRAPELHQFIESHNTGRFPLKLHSVQLTNRFEIKLIKIPTTGIPLWFENVLLIGFPLMQTLPKKHFDCAASAKLMQYSNASHLVTRWLAQLTYTWSLYPETLKARGRIDDHLLHLFFSWYVPFYKSISRYIVQQSDMLGEQYTLIKYNDQDILEGIEAQAVSEYFLQKYFWPNTIKRLNNSDSSSSRPLQPYSKLPTSLDRNLTPATVNKILWRLDDKQYASEAAPLGKRISNIGHSRIKPLKVWSGTAGKHYFGESYPRVVSTMNNHWLAANKPSCSTPSQETAAQHKQKLQLNTIKA
ncbi:hypothetical protein ACFL0R_01720 [Pseudomonadota bacterium]